MKYHLNCEFITNGVDLDKFHPVSKDMKIILRKKYLIPQDPIVILHVGNLRKGRNLESLNFFIDRNDFFILIISSTSIKTEWLSEKIAGNLKIITDYVSEIQEIYQLADIYLFTPKERPFAVDIPLSVLEACATNLFIVSTNFYGLNEIFREDRDYKFYENEDEMINGIIKFNPSNKTNNRSKVIDKSWSVVISSFLQLCHNYSKPK